MEIDIVKEKETPLLSRKRITAWAHSQGATPSRAKIKQEIAKALKADEKLVIIKHIYTRFGMQDTKVIAHVYNDRATLERLENKKLVEKHNVEAPKEEEAPKAEEKTKAPAEPVAKEAKPEEKKEEATEEKPAEEAKPEEKKEEATEEKPAEEAKPEEKKE